MSNVKNLVSSLERKIDVSSESSIENTFKEFLNVMKQMAKEIENCKDEIERL